MKINDSTPELVEDQKQRLLYRQAAEVALCWEEGVIDDPREADVGAILAWALARGGARVWSVRTGRAPGSSDGRPGGPGPVIDGDFTEVDDPDANRLGNRKD